MAERLGRALQKLLHQFESGQDLHFNLLDDYFMNSINITKESKVYIAGHNGMVGSSILRKLKSIGYTNILVKSKKELNLMNFDLVLSFFKKEKP